LPYASAKAGVIGFTRQLAFELGEFGINVNGIALGITLSSERIIKNWERRSEAKRNKFLETIPLKRLAKLEEVAQVALFLASEKGGYITGSTIDVNGGRFMQ